MFPNFRVAYKKFPVLSKTDIYFNLVLSHSTEIYSVSRTWNVRMEATRSRCSFTPSYQCKPSKLYTHRLNGRDTRRRVIWGWSIKENSTGSCSTGDILVDISETMAAVFTLSAHVLSPRGDQNILLKNLAIKWMDVPVITFAVSRSSDFFRETLVIGQVVPDTHLVISRTICPL